jgi:hypothetical protein
MNILINYMKFLFSKQFVTIFNVDQYSHYKLGTYCLYFHEA